MVGGVRVVGCGDLLLVVVLVEWLPVAARRADISVGARDERRARSSASAPGATTGNHSTNAAAGSDRRIHGKPATTIAMRIRRGSLRGRRQATTQPKQPLATCLLDEWRPRRCVRSAAPRGCLVEWLPAVACGANRASCVLGAALVEWLAVVPPCAFCGRRPRRRVSRPVPRGCVG